jgi:hypothetical protein
VYLLHEKEAGRDIGTGKRYGTGNVGREQRDREQRPGTWDRERTGKTAKNLHGPEGTAPPPPKKKSLSDRGPTAQNGGITPTLYISKNSLTLSKQNIMYNDLTVKNGRLINNRPNGITGIQEAAQIKKDLKKAKKIQMYSEAVAIGMQKAKMMKY